MHDKPGSKTLEEGIEELSNVEKIVAGGAYKGKPPFTANGRIEWAIAEREDKQQSFQSTAEAMGGRKNAGMAVYVQTLKQGV